MQHLDGDVASQGLVPRAIHDAHATFTKLFGDAVTSDGAAKEGWIHRAEYTPLVLRLTSKANGISGRIKSGIKYLWKFPRR